MTAMVQELTAFVICRRNGGWLMNTKIRKLLAVFAVTIAVAVCAGLLLDGLDLTLATTVVAAGFGFAVSKLLNFRLGPQKDQSPSEATPSFSVARKASPAQLKAIRLNSG